MSRAYQCDICKSFYCDNENTNSKIIERINLFKLSGTDVYSLYDTNTNSKFDADICPNCTKRIQDTIDDIIRERLENKKK